MKVIYKEPIWKKINKEILHAKTLDKEIERIILTLNEWDELKKFLSSSIDYAIDKEYIEKNGTYDGIKVEVDCAEL